MKRKILTAVSGCCLGLCAMMFSPLPTFAADTIAITDQRATPSYWTKHTINGDKVLLTQQEISTLNRTMREKSKTLVDLAAYNIHQSAAAVKEMILAAQQDYRGEETPGEAYGANGKQVPTAHFKQVKANCNLEGLTGNITGEYALITERTNMRLLPTADNYFDDVNCLHYDNLQTTALDPAEPVIILHKSKDGAFAFCQARHYTGWVSLSALAITDRKHWQRYVNSKDFLVVTANKKVVSVGGTCTVLFQMGSVIPLASNKLQAHDTWLAYVPVEVNGVLSEATVKITDDDSVHKGFLPCTPNNFIRQSMKFLGDEYGWGGMDDSVDCSSFVADIYRSMGIELPRDADQQELAMSQSLKFDGLTTAQRFAKVKEAPVGALLFKPGHVMMYLGQDAKGNPLVIHSASSYFTFDKGQKQKHYIRKVLVSDLHYQNGKAVETIDGLTSAGFCAK
ncbi:SH3 domain-containing protein [Selenomonas sp. FC4001]|uniref:SH3 domain-containing protein n=1 Tax=Selenomonas sp. FC4001 TaxID=1408313 RepID=UPI00068FF6FF|nr:SH3 domain-containing protein [Selenomonas sp. FC4001]